MAVVHYDDTIGQFSLGAVVKDADTNLVGHVTGFVMNSSQEVIVRVKFCNGKEHELHPSFLTVMPAK